MKRRNQPTAKSRARKAERSELPLARAALTEHLLGPHDLGSVIEWVQELWQLRHRLTSKGRRERVAEIATSRE